MNTPTIIGANKAKRHLSELLSHVRNGRRYTITFRGKAVAVLVPVRLPNEQDAIEAAAAMERFMIRQPPIRSVDIKALIEDGRI